MTPMEEWAQFYDDNGLTFFPLFGILNGQCRCSQGPRCSNPGKHPTRAWKGMPSRLPGPLDNIGVSTDSLVVVDIDTPDPNLLAEFPGTFTTGTGRGYHLWYAADPTKPVKTCAGWRPHIDVRAHGGLVVAPPSRHISGVVYGHVRGDSIQPVPAALLNSLPERSARRHTHPPAAPLTAHEIRSDSLWDAGPIFARDMLAWEGSRNQTLFRLGCRFYEWARTGAIGRDALAALVEAARETGLQDEEIVKTLDSARKSA